ncbi:MAG: His/Gly/Thr/Pro-type tRNA ligase C-terminal domain-containing protein, partial [Maritimibacter sp.]
EGEAREAVLRTIDKFDKVGEAGVRELLGKGRLDASGAYIDGVGLSDEQAEPVIAFLTARRATNEDTLLKLMVAVGESAVGAEGVGELAEMVSLLEAQGYGADRIVIDPSVVRGLGYYTGPVFEAELTFEILDEKGIGVDRLLAALRAKGRMDGASQGPVVITVMDRGRMGDYQAMVGELRAAGIRAEVYLGNPKNFGNQLKYADKRLSPVAVIEGGEEHERGVVQIKDLVLGAKLAENATLEEWKERPSQIEVPRADLVVEVQKMLAAYDE